MDDSIYTTVLPLWWGALFIGITLFLRYNKDHTVDPTKRFFLFLLLLAIFAFASYMPFGIMAVVIPVMIVLTFFKWLKGPLFKTFVVVLGVICGASLTYVFYKFDADRKATIPIINERFTEDPAEWNAELLRYAAKQMEFVKPDEPDDPLKPKGNGFFTPDLEEGGVSFAPENPAVWEELELQIPVPENMAFHYAVVGNVLYLTFTNPDSEVMRVILYNRQNGGGVLEECREAYVDENAQRRDLQAAAEFFQVERFEHFFLTEQTVVQNSADAIIAAAIVNITPKAVDGKKFGFGFDTEIYSGAARIEDGSARVFVISALRDMKMNSVLPLHWFDRFLRLN
jgi:hypothetical protein